MKRPHRWITALATVLTVLVVGWTRETAHVLVPTVVVFGLALLPTYGSSPARPIAQLKSITKHVIAGVSALAIAGYLGATFVPEPEVLLLSAGSLVLVLVAVFSVFSRHESEPVVTIVGDDPSLIEDSIRSLPVRPIGYLSPALGTELASTRAEPNQAGQTAPDVDRLDRSRPTTDGGELVRPQDLIEETSRIGGLSRLRNVLRESNVDTVVLAFREADRQECFGVLKNCHDLGVEVLAHESLRNRLLIADEGPGDLVEVELEPWPWYSRLAKRAFDVAFATAGLVLLSPAFVLIAMLVKLDSSGPVFYRQRRTSELGGTLTVLKFRTMVPESEVPTPSDDEENERITRIGRILRKTHLDESPQLLSVLSGDMSVVGPRAAWVKEEYLLNAEVQGWPKRWHVKPGLTGLAQIQDATSTEGRRKLELDLAYVRRQAFLYDCRIVFAQIRLVVTDTLELLRRRTPFEPVRNDG
ncbi:sugar transferase [Haloarchaeobius sp. HRN-SO-5]|uniref:sugar transferase n=1 Tax=Haloarchaeobius sp. HRN-SO-5 TaxID=3446118 RepID=UPI003EBEEE95